MTNIPYLIKQNQSRWSDCQITPSRKVEVMLVARRLVAEYAKNQYLALEKATGVPWFIVAVIHEREADQNWACSLAQGDRWNRVSTHVPRGRGPFKSFFDAGVDSLVKCPPFASRWKDWTPGGALTLTVLYNGTGYEDFHHEASPYVWGATNHEEWGKYVGDGVYNAHVWDTQLGCAAMLLGMIELDPSIKFADSPQPATQNPFDTLWVQQQLNKIGYNLVADGINGTKTFLAIKDFQSKHHIAVDGQAGPVTIAELQSSIDPGIAGAKKSP
jgi:lysozyme family protein